MNSHVRINLDANFAALQALGCSVYKVLLYLANRADKIGRSWPSRDTIAKDCNLHWQTVDKALDSLVEGGYVAYLRKNAYDPILGQKLPNVYMVSPYFLELAESAQPEALDIWQTHTTKISYINQQQNQVPLNNTSNQHQNQQQQPVKAAPQTAKPQTAQIAAKPPTNSQRSVKNQHSAIVKKYTNPVSIIEPLADGLQELLAERLNGYKIPKPMARGFIFKYGYETVHKACMYFEFVKAFQDVNRPGGFFRSILEHGSMDADLPAKMQLVERDYTGGQFRDFVES